MHQIDIQKIRETLPSHAKVNLLKGKQVWEIHIMVAFPSMKDINPMGWEKDFQDAKDKQRGIIGEALSEFFTETEGHIWRIYLKRIPLEFINI